MSIIEGFAVNAGTTTTIYGLGTIGVFADSIDNAPYGIVFASPNDIVFGVEGDSIGVTVVGSGVTITGELTVNFAILDGETIRDTTDTVVSSPATFGNGNDFTSSACTSQNSCRVTVEAGESQAILPFEFFADNPPPEGQENFRIALRPGDGYELPQTQSTITVNITETPQVGFSTAGPIDVFWGGNVPMTLLFRPPLPVPVNYGAAGIRFSRGEASSGFSSANTEEVAGGNLSCGVGITDITCRFTDSVNTDLPIGTSEFTGMLFLQRAAADVGRPLTLSLLVDVRDDANAAIPGTDNDYQFENQNLVFNIINPTVTRTTAGEIEIAEGQSGNVIFTRFPIIGNGDGFTVGVGFPNVNGASAADIAAINVNEADADCILTPPISCTGDFGGGVGDLVVSISIAADVGAAEADERIVLTLLAQNAHDVDPAAFLATVIIRDVPPVIGLSQANPPNRLTAEGDTGIYTFAIDRQRATPTQISFQISGNDLTADEIIILPETGTTPIPGCVANAPCVISLPENEDSVVVRLSARIDARLENTETWTLQLLTNPGEHYTVAPSANRIVSDITNTRFEAGFREAAASVREGTSYTVNITADIDLLAGDSFTVTLNRSFPTGPPTATQADITYAGDECSVAVTVCIRTITITGTVTSGVQISVLTISIVDDGDGDADEIVRFSLADANSPFTADTATLDLTITETPQVGFSTAGPINVAWGDLTSAPNGNLTLTLRFSPPIVNEGYQVQIRGVNNPNVQPFGGFGTCVNDAAVGGVCDLLNPQLAVPAGSAEFTLTVRVLQPAAIGGVTISLRSDPTGEYSLATLNLLNSVAIGGSYEFSNATLNVNVINPIITRSTPSPIEIAEGASGEVLFTRSPVIGNGNDFTVGVGFANGADADDIAAIEINGTPCGDFSDPTPPTSCMGDFGDTIGDLTVSIAIAEDVGTAEVGEGIVLNLQAQNAHDVDPAGGLLATVIIGDVAPVVSLTETTTLTREGGVGEYAFNIDRQQATTISFQISGNDLTADEIAILNASNATISDCVPNEESASILAECVIFLPGSEASVVVRLSARIDARLENTETLTLQLLDNDDNGQHYTVGAANRIVSDITNTRFQAGFREAAASVREGTSYTVNITASIALEASDSFIITLRRTFAGGPPPASPADITYDAGAECNVAGNDCIRTINGPVALGATITVLTVTAVAESPALPDADEIVSFTLLADTNSPFTAVPDSFDLTITETQEVGFSTGGPINVVWGQNLEISVELSSPLSTNPVVALPFNFSALGFDINWVDAGTDLDCAGTVCVLTDPDETQSPIVATVQFTQEAAATPSRAVTVSLADAAYLDAVNAAGDDTYTFGNRRLVVNVINPIIARTTPEEIEIREGESADVIFTRDPIVGNGDNFAVGVGFPNVNGASAADIESIAVNGTPCNLAVTPPTPISCPGNFGSTSATLTVAISITVDFELNESQELIVLSLQAQNDHDVDPAAFLATVTIVNVNPQVGFTNAPADIFWGEAIAPLVAVNPASPRAVSVSVLATAPAAGAIVIANLLPDANPDSAAAQCATTVDGQRRCQIAVLAQDETTPAPSAVNSLQTGPFGGYDLMLVLDDASVNDAIGQIYAPTPAAATLTISISRYAVTLSVANTLPGGFQVGEEGVIQILDNDAQAGGIPSWADGDFSVAISVSGGEEGTDWVMHPLPEDAAGVAQGLPIANCATNCDIAWTDTTNGANAYLRILQRTGAILSVYLLDEPRAATTPATTPGAISVIAFTIASPIVASFVDNSDAVITEGGGALSRNIQLSGGSRTAFTLSVSIFSPPGSTPAKYNGIDNLSPASPGDDDFSVASVPDPDPASSSQCTTVSITGGNDATICTFPIAVEDPPLLAIPFGFTALADAIVEETESFLAVILSSNAYNVADNAINGRIVNAAFQLNFADTNPSVQEGQQVTISLAGPPGLALRGGISIDFQIDESTDVTVTATYGTDEDYVFVSDTDIVECGDSPSGGIRNCYVVFPADATVYALTVDADADTDVEGIQNFVLRLIENPGVYTPGDAAVVTGRITETPEVSFNIAARTALGEAFFTGYWGTINGQQSFRLPLRILPPYPASGTPPILVVDSVGRNFGSTFTVPTRLNGISSDCGNGTNTCDREIREYASGDITDFELPVFLSGRANAGQLITLAIDISGFDPAGSLPYAVADPASVVISILAPNLSVGRVNPAESSNEGDIVHFEFTPFDELDGSELPAFPGQVFATISITFADDATSADYELQNNAGVAIAPVVQPDSSVDVYRIEIAPFRADSELFQVSVVRDASAEPLADAVDAESITINLLRPAAVSEGYGVTDAATVGLPLALGNAPVIVGFGDNTPTFVEEGRMTEITVTLEVAPAAGESFEFRFGVLGPAIAAGVPAVAILNDAAGVVCRPDGGGLLCDSSFFVIDDTLPDVATASEGFVITLSTALEVVDADDARNILLLARPQDTNPHFVDPDGGSGIDIRNVPRIQFLADAASAAWGDSHFTLTLDLDSAASSDSTAGTLTFRNGGVATCTGFGIVGGGTCDNGTVSFQVARDATSVPVTISLAATRSPTEPTVTNIGEVFNVSLTPPDTLDPGARTEFQLTVTRATLQAVRPTSPIVATEGGAAVQLMWQRIGGGSSGGTDYDPIAAPVQFRITNPDTGQERSGWIVTGAATDPPGNCGSIPSNLQFVRCDNSVAWTAALVNYVVGVRVTADLLNEESDYQLTMALEDNTNFDSARYEISDFPNSAVEWVAENVDVVVTPLAALNSDLRAVLAEGGALLPVTLSIPIDSPGNLPVEFNFQGAEFNEVAVYNNNALSLLAPVGVNYQATISVGQQFTVVQVSAIVNVDLADELWNLTVTSPDGSGSLPITVAVNDDIVVQLAGNTDVPNVLPAPAVFPEHRGVISLTLRTWLRDGASSEPLPIQPGETVEFSFAANPAPDDINIAGAAPCPTNSECLIQWQNTVAITVSEFTVALTPVLDFADEGGDIFNYEIGDIPPARLDAADTTNSRPPIYRLQLTDPPVGDFDSQNIEAAINTQILITVSFEGPAADVADVRAELRLHFRGANVANASASGVVDFRRNTPDLECTTVGVPSGVTSMCDLNSTFALDNGDAVITLFADENLDREVRVSLFNRRVENSPRDDDLLFRDNEARIIFSPLLVHTGAAASAEGAEGGDAFIIGTVTVGVPLTARSEIVNVTLSVGLSAATGRHPSDFSLLRGTTQTLDVIPSSDDTAILFLLPIGINDTAITIRATAVADLANVPISIEGGEGSEAFTVSVVTDAAVGITPGGATFSLPFTVTPGPAVIRFADTSPLRFLKAKAALSTLKAVCRWKAATHSACRMLNPVQAALARRGQLIALSTLAPPTVPSPSIHPVISKFRFWRTVAADVPPSPAFPALR